MRYHKAVEITTSEADHIITTSRASLAGAVVISNGKKWFDVRDMTRVEIEAFAADLARSDIVKEARSH